MGGASLAQPWRRRRDRCLSHEQRGPNEADDDENDAGKVVEADERRWWDDEKPEHNGGAREATTTWKGERLELSLYLSIALTLSSGGGDSGVTLLTAVMVTLLPLFSIILFFVLRAQAYITNTRTLHTHAPNVLLLTHCRAFVQGLKDQHFKLWPLRTMLVSNPDPWHWTPSPLSGVDLVSPSIHFRHFSADLAVNLYTLDAILFDACLVGSLTVI
ncbi:hypothetical protein PIB30_054322 [Stylosanthes scabra]|uniref:Uncharacterized protein n=1 Tax=Stylosanthes scabra TaxID=79078 RepID=A0ABU6TJ52_9FABA|nr:hypothetical protein [Stylosanthes scabra]